MNNLYKNKKVLTFGLGLNDGGIGITEFFVKQGAIVTVTDGKNKEQLDKSLKKLEKYKNKIKYRLGGHEEEDFIESDIIVRNPAIPPTNKYLQLAQKHNKEIVMEMALFLELFKGMVIGVTGTKGKSTTTTLIYELLKKEIKKEGDRKIILGGNIGKSAIRELPKLTNRDMAVLELSSFQLEGMGESKVSPNIAVITNVYEDHLNWHQTKQEYIEAKKNILKYQTKKDICIVNSDDKTIQSFISEIESNLITVSLTDENVHYYINKDLKVIDNYSHSKKGDKVVDLSTIKLKGKHNYLNILLAVAAAKIRGINNTRIQEVLNNFKGVEGRQEFIREVNGVKFYNDTTATNLDAVKAALDTFGKDYSKKIIMIAGGVDKGLEYSKIKDEMEKHLKALVLLEGTASEKIYTTLSHSELDSESRIHKYYNNFEKAIKKAYATAEPGDIVILCPGASSFNMFANEFDRGEQFNKIVNQLK